MRLATLRDGTRDGTLIVVDPSGTRYAPASSVARTLQAALDDWDTSEGPLKALAEALTTGEVESHPIDFTKLGPPLPRAYEWVDGSAYINHIILVRKARNAEPPETLHTSPLVYQGGSGVLLGPRDAVPLVDPAWGLDFESEICVVLGDTPVGTTKDKAGQYVRLLMLANDLTLRNLIPPELKKGFGFFQSKPATAFSPFAITPDELGEHWRDGRIHLPLHTHLNGTLAGDPAAGPEMHFSFFDLVEHVTRTRAFTAGTIIGSGTISNADPERGVSCLAERRMREIIETGEAKTSFRGVGDQVHIEMKDEGGRSLFGTIEQTVVAPEAQGGA